MEIQEKMGIKVAKFGGSSVAGPEQFQKVKAIIDADPERRVVVSSAAGKRSGDDHKLTDLLYLVHAHLTYGVSCEEILHTIEQRLLELRDSLGLRYAIEKDLAALRSRLSRDLSVDELVSRGEYFTSRLLAEYLGFAFVDAADVIFFGLDGQVDREKTDAAIAAALAEHGKILIPGFYGRLPTGRIKVMSRGGSDITGALAAAAVGADVYENWTDVSGILMADPRIVPDPNPIPHITFAELRELAFMGATGIAGRKNFTIIKVLKRNMNQSATLRHALEILDRYHAPVEHITLGLDSFSLVSSSAALGDGLYDVIADIRKNCRPDDVQIQDGIALVASVGRQMASRPGISGRLFAALGAAGVNIRTIAQDADELSITVGVQNEQFETAIRVLYDGFTG